MGKTTVHRWRRYDIASDEYVTSRRYGSQEAIDRVGGEIIPESSVEIDDIELDPDFPGMTTRSYSPPIARGFQTEVKD